MPHESIRCAALISLDAARCFAQYFCGEKEEAARSKRRHIA
jgi:hypothetical protein